jgi:hypothetical protein
MVNISSGSSNKFNKKLAVIATVVIIIVAVVAAQQVIQLLQRQPSNNSSSNIILPAMNLTVTGSNGQELVLHSSDIASLEAFTEGGGYKRANGDIRDVGNYTGVPILTICNLVGGLTTNSTIRVTAADNYKVIYTYQQVNGQELNTYDPITGNATQSTKPLTMIVAYYMDGARLSSSDGPLRIAIVGPQGLLTDGRLWTRLLVKIEILNSK